MEQHGGYLVRLERLDAVDLVGLASAALRLDGGDPHDAALQISSVPRRKVVRLAYDSAAHYGAPGARWYETHHALARALSREAGVTVHAYAITDDGEQVVAYGDGRRVGGERLRYDEADIGVDLSVEGFEKAKARWPLGHLAYVFGVTRQELLALPRAPSQLLTLEGTERADRGDEPAAPQLLVPA